VAFERLYGRVVGRYVPLPDRIEIDPDVRGPLLERVVRHELCHALDFDEDLVTRPHPVWDALVLRLFHLGRVDAAGLEGPRNRRSEAFAQFCDLGPLLAQALADGCPGDPADVDYAAAWILHTVWREWDVPRFPGPGPAVASWTAPSAALFDDEFGVLGLEDPNLIRVAWGEARVDLSRAEGAPVDGPYPVVAPQEELPRGLVGLCPLSGFSYAGAGWSDGPAAVLFGIDVYAGLATPRVLANDGGRWAWVEGCVDAEHADVFVTSDHRIWLATVDDGTVQWTPLLE
jgi:hypothetical protein